MIRVWTVEIGRGRQLHVGGKGRAAETDDAGLLHRAHDLVGGEPLPMRHHPGARHLRGVAVHRDPHRRGHACHPGGATSRSRSPDPPRRSESGPRPSRRPARPGRRVRRGRPPARRASPACRRAAAAGGRSRRGRASDGSGADGSAPLPREGGRRAGSLESASAEAQLNFAARAIHFSRSFSFGLSGVPGWMMDTGQRSAAVTSCLKVPADASLMYACLSAL